MAAVLLTYDIKTTTSTIHTDLKNRLINHYGYSQTIDSDDRHQYYLPNTTVRKPNTTSESASKDFINACQDVKAVWERYIASEYSKATFNNQ